MLFGLDRLAGGLESSDHCRTKSLLVIIVEATLDVLNVDGHNPYETFVVTAWIWYAKDLGPLYVMSLPSGICFKIRTSSWLGHFSINTMSHISKMSSG